MNQTKPPANVPPPGVPSGEAFGCGGSLQQTEPSDGEQEPLFTGGTVEQYPD